MNRYLFSYQDSIWHRAYSEREPTVIFNGPLVAEFSVAGDFSVKLGGTHLDIPAPYCEGFAASGAVGARFQAQLPEGPFESFIRVEDGPDSRTYEVRALLTRGASLLVVKAPEPRLEVFLRAASAHAERMLRTFGLLGRFPLPETVV